MKRHQKNLEACRSDKVSRMQMKEISNGKVQYELDGRTYITKLSVMEHPSFIINSYNHGYHETKIELHHIPFTLWWKIDSLP